MTVQESAEKFRDAQRRDQAATVVQIRRRWREINPDRIVESWGELLSDAVEDVSVAQRRAAERGAAYTPEVLAKQGATSNPAGQVRPQALSGVASDGRPLDTLLELPARQAVGRIGQGASPSQALQYGSRKVGMLAGTQALDAGRMGASVGMVSDLSARGYRRQLTPPSCSRCAILAGKWYQWNTGFLRHPSCDCVHVPSTGPSSDLGGLRTFDPDAYFRSLPPAQQDRHFTKAGAEAIRDGADMGQVVNSRRGMHTTTMYGQRIEATTVGTRSLGVSDSSFIRAMAREQQQVNVRLMPEQIYRDARDRDDAIRLLRRFGYLSD